MLGFNKRNRQKTSQPQRSAAANQSGGIKKATYEHAKKKEVGVSDLTLLSQISDNAINENLHKRFDNALIYTYIGHVLISVNPFRDLGIYSDEILKSYKGKNRLEVPPHVFAIAESMYHNMVSYNDNQCVIISGESGAGKTEAAKRIMQYIAEISSSITTNSNIQKIKDMVLATNPLLESFGCAKTLRNDNSSRHGKYLEIQFNKDYQPVSANITNYLLEKQRVVGQIKNERNFHIFYQLTKGAPDNYRKLFGVQQPDKYIYTSKSNCINVNSIDDLNDFQGTLKAMDTIGLTQIEKDNVFRLLSAILWIGNVSFSENDEGNSQIADTSVTDFIAYLLQVDSNLLCKVLTERVMQTSHGMKRGSIYNVPLNKTQALAVRDALSKGIYNNLFDWIVDRVNLSFASLGNSNEIFKSIGILDIYGFEIFDHNSFEQLCINYVNEKLQQIFIQLTLKSEQDEYVREKIQWTPIKFFNNKIVCDLIEAKNPPGVFSTLNDAIATAHADSNAADQSFAQRINIVNSNPHFDLRGSKFIIKHYAGDVTYEIDGMTDKNKDQMLKDLLDLLESSNDQFIKNLFPINESDSNSKRRPATAGDKIKKSANELVENLSKCTPSYIRTIKPNENRSPSEFNSKNVLHQVKYLGLQENVRIRRAGFAYRQTYEKFVERFYLLSTKTSYAGEYIYEGDAKSATEIILNDSKFGNDEWQLGETKVFIKKPETLFALEDMRDNYWGDKAKVIQRACRKWLKRRENAAKSIQKLWRSRLGKINESNKYTELRDFGNSIVYGKKQRRRLSVLGSRQFLGDYLGCNDKTGGFGKFIMNKIGLKEKIMFSGRGEQLHSKFGRSSQRLPKVFLITNKNNFIVIGQSIIERKIQYQIEFNKLISNIPEVSVSNLADDWLAINLNSNQEPDLFINCLFKTELLARFRKANPSLKINISDSVSYFKKPGKKHTIKFKVDTTAPTVGDAYKSSTVSVIQGSSATTSNKQPPKPKSIFTGDRIAAYKRQAQTNGNVKILRQNVQPQSQPVKPSAASKPAIRTNKPVSPVIPQQKQTRKVPPVVTPRRQPQQPQPRQQKPAPVASVVPVVPVVPPAPPAPPSIPSLPIYIAEYDFPGDNPGTLKLTKGQTFEIVKHETNGWSLAKIGQTEGWVPTAYIKEHKSGPPAVTVVTNNSVTGGSIADGLANALKEKTQNEHTMASDLAAAIRSKAKRESDDEEDDDDEW